MSIGQSQVGIRTGFSRPAPKIRIGVLKRSQQSAGMVEPSSNESFQYQVNGAAVFAGSVTFDFSVNGGPLGTL